MKILVSMLMLAMFGAVAAKADSVTITFDQPNQVAHGSEVQFFGTITNTGDTTVFLNSDTLNLLGLSFSTNDLFFSSVPVSLAPSGQAGDSSGDIELFDVFVSDPLLDPAATYTGSYTLVGGIDGDAQDVLGTGAFSLTTVPEPASIYLMLSGFSVGLPMLSKKLRGRLSKRNG